MERAVQIFVALNLTVMGISHIARPKVWSSFFIQFRERGEAGVFSNALLHFAFGSLIVSFHNVWQGLPVVLTVYGWLLVLKAFVYFTMPRFGLSVLQSISINQSQKFQIAGIGLLLFAGLITYHLAVTA